MDRESPGWQRHFLALLPDATTRVALAALPIPDGARATHVDDLHMTLAFLGTLAPAGQAAAAAAAAAAWAQMRATHGDAPPDFNLDVLESWPDARVFCLTSAAQPAAPTYLAAAIAARLAEHGLPTDARPFRAHVTLARLGRSATVVPHSRLAPPLRWRSGGFALLASSAVPQPGPRYRVLQRIGADVFSPHPH